MRPGPLVLGVLSILTASCERPTFPKKLASGCYYAQGKPVFKIAGSEGRVLIPGDVQTFKVKSGGDSFHAYATFAPAFTFDFEDAKGAPASVGALADRAPANYSMKSGTSVPTIEMHWGAYGDEDVSLGKAC